MQMNVEFFKTLFLGFLMGLLIMLGAALVITILASILYVALKHFSIFLCLLVIGIFWTVGYTIVEDLRKEKRRS